MILTTLTVVILLCYNSGWGVYVCIFIELYFVLFSMLNMDYLSTKKKIKVTFQQQFSTSIFKTATTTDNITGSPLKSEIKSYLHRAGPSI